MKKQNSLKNRFSLKDFILNEQETPTEAGVDTTESPLTLREPKTKARPSSDSVDDQIDALLLRYESASIKKNNNLNESLRNLSLKFLLEQSEEEEDTPAEDTPAEDTPAEDTPAKDAPTEDKTQKPAGSDDMSVTSPAEYQKIPDLDIDKFTTRVVRLVNNYNNLLNIEEAIVNRAKTFLDENYGDAFVNEFINNLRDKHGLEASEFTNIPNIANDIFAIGAFAGGTGGLGGGGG